MLESWDAELGPLGFTLVGRLPEVAMFAAISENCEAMFFKMMPITFSYSLKVA